MWWDACHVSWNVFPRSRLNARVYSKVLSPWTSGSGLPYPHPIPCIQFLHSLHGCSNLHMGSEILILAVTACSWSKNITQTTLWGIHRQKGNHMLADYKHHKVDSVRDSAPQKLSIHSSTTNAPSPLKNSLSTLPPQTPPHQQCLCRFRTSRACTWHPCPWLCGSCHHSIWSPEYCRYHCGIVFPLPRELFLSDCSHWVFPPRISPGACLTHHNGPILPATPDRRPSQRHYQQNFNVCWHWLTQRLWLPWRIFEHVFLWESLANIPTQFFNSIYACTPFQPLGNVLCHCPYKEGSSAKPQ